MKQLIIQKFNCFKPIKNKSLYAKLEARNVKNDGI